MKPNDRTTTLFVQQNRPCAIAASQLFIIFDGYRLCRHMEHSSWDYSIGIGCVLPLFVIQVATVMFFIILGIFSVMSASCCIRIGKYSALLNIKRMYDNGWSRASSILLLLSIWCARSPSLQSHQGLHVFAVSEAAREDSNDAITFNTDSSFWVCDNSATGHICNNKLLFDGTLVQS
jgi:hypothetical protein